MGGASVVGRRLGGSRSGRVEGESLVVGDSPGH